MDGLDASYALHEQAYGAHLRPLRPDATGRSSPTPATWAAPARTSTWRRPTRVRTRWRCAIAATTPRTSRWRVAASRRRSSRPTRRREEMATPGVETIEALAAFLGIDPRATAKAMPVVAAGRNRRARARAWRSAPARAEAAQGARPGSPTGDGRGDRGGVRREARIDRADGAVPTIVADETLAHGAYVGGANRTGYHITGLVLGRDYQAQLADLHVVEAGDGCPLCDGGPCGSSRRSRSATSSSSGRSTRRRSAPRISDECGKEQPIVMGSYGIGPARIVAAALEQSHDDDGCVWPAPLAPFDAWLVPIGDEAVVAAQRLEDQLGEHGLTVMIDDRAQGPGSKFADADLIGVPLRVTLGKRTITDGTVDVRTGATAPRRHCRWHRPPPACPSSARSCDRDDRHAVRALRIGCGEADARVRALVSRSRARDRAVGRLPQPPRAGHAAAAERHRARAARARRSGWTSITSPSIACGASSSASQASPELVDRLYAETVQD